MFARTQGRLLCFGPDVDGTKKAVPASHPEVTARFAKESAVKKRGTLLPDIDMMDVNVRQENLNVRGEPLMVQLPLVPSYARASNGRPGGSPASHAVTDRCDCSV